MAKRQVKDAKDISTDELIYFKGHAKATYMSDGTTVEDAINDILGGGSEQVQPDWNETDTNSPAYIANKPNINHYDVGDQFNNVDMILMNNSGTIYWGSSELRCDDNGMHIYCGENSYDISVVGDGDGTKFLSDDGTYKEISSAYALVNHGTSNTTFTLTPNTFHVWDEVNTLDLSFGGETNGVANEYLFQFTSGTEPTTLTLPDTIKWVNDNIPTIESNKIYQISVLKGLGSIMTFSNT